VCVDRRALKKRGVRVIRFSFDSWRGPWRKWSWCAVRWRYSVVSGREVVEGEGDAGTGFGFRVVSGF
jgi:hypothetical protein